MPRRSPTLTNEARRLWEEAILSGGWQPGVTIAAIAEATGLTESQARDAIFAESADPWRRKFAESLRKKRPASPK